MKHSEINSDVDKYSQFKCVITDLNGTDDNPVFGLMNVFPTKNFSFIINYVICILQKSGGGGGGLLKNLQRASDIICPSEVFIVKN